MNIKGLQKRFFFSRVLIDREPSMVDPHRAVPSAAVLGTVQADWGQGSQIELPQIRTLVKAL